MKPVAALAYRMTGDRDASFDLAQDTFVSAWQNLGGYRGEAGFESWVLRIAGNKTLNHLKAERRTVTGYRFDGETAEISTEPDSALVKEELRRGVLEFMQSLPEQQRLVFNLRFYRELTFEEIATVLDKAIGTVKTNYREAVKKLRVHAMEKGWRE